MADDTATAPAPDDGGSEEQVEEVVETDEQREELLGRFSGVLGDAIVDSLIEPGVDLTIRVRTDAWRAAADVARNHLGAKYFCFVSAIDWLPSPYGRSMDSDVDTVLAAQTGDVPEPASAEIVRGTTGGETRFQVFGRLAHVGGEGEFWGVTLKADVPDELVIDSWVPIFAGADWHERETWEMFGITFVGHPGLRHIYLPGDFEGNPLRKDYPLISRMVKPWPGIVDVEPMPTDEAADGADADGPSAGETEGGEA
ncbi:NADH-quinone oxidoreductase subunit C [Dermatobacter hominis]|uniref:NADH-quinone oxidoreductase subunit C n=1 Tax=Dermatobacter hominis TaxID=2884263 RepID=UPI001D11E0BF|nr:NADH-quinone oxidoreductase subunit C [Dermatobacter hominis]UDY33919.1 NADH-quinone oxidoreductase subunit C [Dermatobacter hominis]